jgi:DNA repair protein RecO (recombination protein O)
MNERVDQQAVYILNRRAYRETSLIIDVFSINYGRFSLVAKGAMRKRSQWSALLQPFQSLLVSWSGRSTLKTLVSAEAPSQPFKLNSAYLFSAYYLNELLIKLLPESEPNSQVFEAYVNALCGLNDKENIQLTLRHFEFLLLRDVGQLPDFFYDINNQSINAEALYFLGQKEGFECASATLSRQKDQHVISGRILCMLRSSQSADHNLWLKDDYRQAKYLMRLLVDSALGGQEIKSRELFRQLKF